MPNIHPSFPRLHMNSDGNARLLYTNEDNPIELCTLETATQCLEEFTQEENIQLSRLPQSNINLFLETCRYAPYDIDLDTIARDCGITVENYIQAEPTMQQVSARTGSRFSPSDIDFYDFLITDTVAQPQPMVVSQVVHDTLAEIYNSRPTPVQRVVATPVAKRVKKRSEHDMFMEIIRSEEFPKPMFKDWSDNREMNDIINDWYRSVEYREQWIFSRREREGFNRRNIGNFSLDDVMARISKRRNKHSNDTEKSTFYDWKLGGTDWTLQLELYHHEGRYFLITRHIHKPSLAEIKYDVRYWNGNTFKHVGTLFTEQRNKPEYFERVFGTNNPDSDWYDGDDYDNHDEDEDCEEYFEGGSW